MVRRTSCAGACAVACALVVAPAPTAGFLASSSMARIGAARSAAVFHQGLCCFMRAMRLGVRRELGSVRGIRVCFGKRGVKLNVIDGLPQRLTCAVGFWSVISTR